MILVAKCGRRLNFWQMSHIEYGLWLKFRQFMCDYRSDGYMGDPMRGFRHHGNIPLRLLL